MKDNAQKYSANNDHDLWSLFAITMETIARVRNIELAQYGITREQSLVIHLLYNSNGSSTLNQLANSAMRQHNSMSTLVRRMDRAGLVKRKKDPNDNQYTILLTEKGKKIFEEMPLASVEMTFAALSKEEKIRLKDYLDRLQSKARGLLGLDFKPPFLNTDVSSAGRSEKIIK
jgi:MarR family transcriptional regulator, organic hydroperoxide resistance regulator